MPARGTSVAAGGDRQAQPQAARVSIIIPVYNCEAYLGEAIESALAQSVPGVEVIVIDDGSTDGSRAVATGYPGVTLVSQPNGGQGTARNHGLRLSTGAAIIFLDSDDRLHADAARTGLAALEAHPKAGVVFGSNRIISASGAVTGLNPQTVRTFHFADVATGTVPTPSQCMFRRSSLLAIGGFDDSIRFSEDFDLFLRLTLQAEGHCHGAYVVDYRMHPDQATKRPSAFLHGMLTHLGKVIAACDLPDRAALHSRSKRHWRRYFGQFIPQEVVKNALAGRFGISASAAGIYVANMPNTLYGSFDFLSKRLRARSAKGRSAPGS